VYADVAISSETRRGGKSDDEGSGNGRQDLVGDISAPRGWEEVPDAKRVVRGESTTRAATLPSGEMMKHEERKGE
jgi:hypothetical protein